MKILILAILILISVIVKGQVVTQVSTPSLQLLGSAGGTYYNTSYQLDWSIGEILTETYTGSQNSLTQGFHQSNFTITAIAQMKDSPYEITAFPNPTTDYVILKIESEKFIDMNYLLTDITGKVLQESKVGNNTQLINLTGLASGVYFLAAQTKKKTVKTFKIIKSN